MAIAPNLPASSSRLPIIAVSLAGVAVALVVVMVIVVVSRRARPGYVQQPVSFADLGKLKRDVIAAGEAGVTITDAAVRASIGLEDGDVVTAVAGKPTTHDYDVTSAIRRSATMGSKTIDVDVMRDHAPMLLRWQIAGDPTSVDVDVGALGGGASLATADPDPLVDTIQQADPLHVNVPQSTVDKLFANPTSLLKSARVVPAVRDGKPNGFKIYAVRPHSLLDALGFKNGDTVTGVNGYNLSTPDKALEVYTKLRSVKEFSVDLERRGAPMILSIDIKP